MAHGKKQQCWQYDKQGNFIAVYESLAKAGASLGKTLKPLCNCLHGQRGLPPTNYAWGYYWFTEDKGKITVIEHKTNPEYRAKERINYDIKTNSYKMWHKFCERFPSTEMTYVEYKAGIDSINEYYRGHMLETGHITYLPFGNGKMMVQKNKQQMRSTPMGIVPTAPIDWTKTTSKDNVSYHRNHHSNGYNLRYMWFANSSYIDPPSIWKMSMTQESKDLLKVYSTPKYSEMYRECFSKAPTIALTELTRRRARAKL